MILALLLAFAPGARQDAPPPAGPPKVPVELEVLANVKAQPIGPATVDDLNLPDEFLKRVSDRIVRSSFENRFRIVVPDPPAAAASSARAPRAKEPNRVLLYLLTGAGLALVAVIIAVRRTQRSAG